MSNRESIRSAMNAAFLALPEWLRSPFEPMRENLTLLFDANRDDLALAVVQAIPTPAGWTDEQAVEFEAAKAGIISGIELLMADAIANDPFRSPEALAMIALAAERRAL